MYSAISAAAGSRVAEGKDAMLAVLAKLLRNEKGTTGLEYAFVASLVSIVAFFLISSIGSSVSADFTSVADALRGPAASVVR
jgi:Flp pilus assembly pilin Flp